jgi:hypothetical protein
LFLLPGGRPRRFDSVIHFGSSAATFALSTTEEFEHQDRLLDVFPFGSEFRQHFIDVHRGYDRTVLGMGTSVLLATALSYTFGGGSGGC